MIPNVPIRNTILSRNELGRFFIDQNCAGCKNCFSLAPSNIEFISMAKRCSVVLQPMSDEELAILNKAYQQCPQHAFHDKADVLVEGMD